MKKKSIGITYTTDKECILQTAWTKDECMHLLCVSGSATFLYSDRPFMLNAGEIAIMSRPDVISAFTPSDDFAMECLVAPLQFLYNQLPANHFGVVGCVNLWDNPIVPLNDIEQTNILTDFHRLATRISETNHPFYEEMIGSLALTMVYDMFATHSRRNEVEFTTERNADIVSKLLKYLSSGLVKHHREVAYYANLLNVSPKYLSNLVRRQTGRSVMYLIDQYTTPLIVEYLKNEKMSLTQIAGEMGFSSLSYFSRYVQKQLGVTPSNYRASLQPRK